MPSLNIPFTDDELEAVRNAAAGDDMSLRAFAHRAILSAASEHRRRVAEASKIVTARTFSPLALPQSDKYLRSAITACSTRPS
jgi:hypothetical protein